jgi:signal transduction histidine kinase
MRLVDMGELAEAVCASLQVGAEQQIRVVAEPGIIVLGDEVRLEQAVSNLVGNAIKHGPENGEIRVSVSSQGERARLAVEDDGPGLPEDQWETVFERGKRGPTSSGKPGLGLGLYIVRVVAEAHGGTAYIERSSTGGSRFVFELPLEQTDDRSPTARARAR